MCMEDGPDFSDVADDEIADALASQFKANDLRKWMAENGLQRERGSNKAESAKQAVDQGREEIAQMLFEENALDVEWDRQCKYHEVCGNTTPGASTDMCDKCLDLVRDNDRSANPVDREQFDDAIDFFEALHERQA